MDVPMIVPTTLLFRQEATMVCPKRPSSVELHSTSVRLCSRGADLRGQAVWTEVDLLILGVVRRGMAAFDG